MALLCRLGQSSNPILESWINFNIHVYIYIYIKNIYMCVLFISMYSYCSLKVPFLGEMTFSAVFSFQLCQLSSQRDPIHSSSAARCTSIYGNFMKFHGVVSMVQKHPETNINKVVPCIQLYHLAPKKRGWKLEDDRSCHVQCSCLLGSCYELYHVSLSIFLGDLHVYKKNIYIYNMAQPDCD